MRKILSMALSVILITGVFAPLSAAAAPPEAPKSGKDFTITGAGATFPFPLIDTWRVEYKKIYPNVNLNYQSIGSGGGVKQHTEKTVNFGASDAPLTQKEMSLAPGTMHIPEAIGSVVMAYYLPEVPNSGLKLTGENVADIYLGKIKKWNDPKIQENNPDLKLPDRSILVTRRSDGSGTTYVFTDYLSKVSPEWEQKVGKGKSVPWPIGVGAAGNEGVAWATRNTKYAIGYVELAYAFQNGMTYAHLQNADKTKFIEPNLESVFAAVNSYSTDQLPKPEGDWSAVSITNAPGDKSYPIASFTYLLVYEDISQAVKDKDQAKALVHLIYWMITDGQKFSKPLLYDPLPPAVQELGKNGLARMTFNGEKLWDYQAKPAIKSAAESKTTVKSSTEKKTTKDAKATTDKKEVKTPVKKEVKTPAKTTDKKDTKPTTIKPTTAKPTKTTSSK